MPFIWCSHTPLSHHVRAAQALPLSIYACPGLAVQCCAGCTFEVVAYTAQKSSMPKESWVEGEPQSPVSSNGGDLPSLVPIKSAQVGSGAFRVQLYAEH